jgi:hypothetical protein
MVLIFMLYMAYGSPAMSFPWWLWTLAAFELLSGHSHDD